MGLLPSNLKQCSRLARLEQESNSPLLPVASSCRRLPNPIAGVTVAGNTAIVLFVPAH
jgi:hypothetical protein